MRISYCKNLAALHGRYFVVLTSCVLEWLQCYLRGNVILVKYHVSMVISFVDIFKVKCILHIARTGLHRMVADL